MLAFLLSRWGAYLAVFLLVLASYGAAYMKGRTHGYDKREAIAVEEAREAQRLLEKLAVARSRVTERVVVQYRDRIKVVTESGRKVDEQINAIPEASAVELPGHWRRLHDLSAAGAVPPAARGVDAEAGVSSTVALRSVAGNYETCHTTSERLVALQRWVREMSEVK
jgi:hypothetical protein